MHERKILEHSFLGKYNGVVKAVGCYRSKEDCPCPYERKRMHKARYDGSTSLPIVTCINPDAEAVVQSDQRPVCVPLTIKRITCKASYSIADLISEES